MGALVDFYSKAKTDAAFKAELEQMQKELGSTPSQDAVCSAMINVAKKHGINLTEADFKVQPGFVDDEELKAVAGGCGGSSCWEVFKAYGPINEV